MLLQTCARVQERKIKSANVNREKGSFAFCLAGFGLRLDWDTIGNQNYTTLTCHRLYNYKYGWLLGLLLLDPRLTLVWGVGKHINTPSDWWCLGQLPMTKSPETNWTQVTGWTECDSRFRGGEGPLAEARWVSSFPGVQSEESTAAPDWLSSRISLIHTEFRTRTCKRQL